MMNRMLGRRGSAAVACVQLPRAQIVATRTSRGFIGDFRAASTENSLVCRRKTLGEPSQGLFLPRVPHRSLVTIETVPTRWQFEVLRGNFMGLERLVKRLAVFGGDRFVV